MCLMSCVSFAYCFLVKTALVDFCFASALIVLWAFVTEREGGTDHSLLCILANNPATHCCKEENP